MEEREAGAERRRFKWVEQVADVGSSTLQLTRERGRWQWLLTRIQATHESSDRFDWPRFAERCRLLRSLREPYHLPVLEVGGTAGRLFVKMASI
ncbi:MAG: hypothetical protein AAFX99_28605, partial [Myxococcota bacterium]